MGNIVSWWNRRCGLCYFKLKPGTPFLNEPLVSQGKQPAWPALIWEEGRLDDVLDPPEGVRTISIKTTLDTLGISSQRGCVGCSAILKYLEDQIHERGVSLDEKCRKSQCQLRWLVGDRKAFYLGLQITTLTNIDAKYRDAKFDIVLGYTGFLCRHPAARKLSRELARGYTGSPGSLRSVQKWIQDCDSAHQRCKQSASQLPYRVLKLSKCKGSISVRLVQDLGQQEKYACLSHRWGKSTLLCRTTKATISTHIQSVPWTNLPKTFQEAAEVTLFLGLEYLWIDSLCIIQDDEDDWKVQAAQMCNIYQGSYITIAATSSNDSDEGLFKTRPRTRIETFNSIFHKMFIYKALDHSYGRQELNYCFSLLSRGWVYQERLLSRRMIHFSSEELRFECAHFTALCQCGDYQSWYWKHEHLEALESFDLAEIITYWHQVVYNYTALDLTHHSDALPALAGVARQHGIAHQAILGRYAAGLWYNTLPYDLIWHVMNGYRSRRSESTSAPTWSWASIAANSVTLGYERVTEDLQVINLDIKLAGPDEYGSVKSAKLSLRGSLVVGSWKWDKQDANSKWVHFYAHGSPKSYFIHMDYNFSIAGNSWHIAEGSKMYIFKTGFVGDGCYVCLVLRKSKGVVGAYERVGLLAEAPIGDVDLWFMNGGTEETIVLV